MAADVSTSKLSYEEAKSLACDDELDVRVALAERSDIQPEILHYLAQDDSSDVRRTVAANVSAPRQSFELLAGDDSGDVRENLATTVGVLGSDLHDQSVRTKAQISTHKTLTVLAKDQILHVRETMAQALKDVGGVPVDVIRILAGDSAVSVSAPVLEHSPVLTDEDLLEIIEEGAASESLSAISRRSEVSEVVSGAVVGTDDVIAIGELLGNASAQIREEVLDDLIDRAAEIDIWHEPLVRRPVLPPTAPEKLAHFIADHLFNALNDRDDVDSETLAELKAQVRSQLGSSSTSPHAKGVFEFLDGPLPMTLVDRLKASGGLHSSVVMSALQADDHRFVLAALVSLAGLDEKVVRRVFAERNPKGIVSLTWKAGLPPSMISHLQHRMARIAPSDVVEPVTDYSDDGALAFPLSGKEMNWNIQFFSGMADRDSFVP